MALTIDDLKPKNFTITIKDVEIECIPLKVSHVMLLQKVGLIFSDVKNATTQQIKDAETDLYSIIEEVSPTLKDAQLDFNSVFEYIEQLMAGVETSETKEIKSSGVTFTKDPKAEKPVETVVG